MRRYRLPLLLGIVGLICTNIISALINILTARIDDDSPYQIYIVPGLISFLVVSLAVYAWQYRSERRAEAVSTDIPADQAKRNRLTMIQKVRATWIEGVLLQSLYREMRLELGLRSDPDKIDIPLRTQIQEISGQPTDLPFGITILDVFDRFGGALLILGAPGGGKTTMLLELTRELLDRAEADLDHAIPVVFNLSSWAVLRAPIAQWLVNELNIAYDVPRKQAQDWISREAILPLFDGLDEVAEGQRAACIDAINTFHAT